MIILQVQWKHRVNCLTFSPLLIWDYPFAASSMSAYFILFRISLYILHTFQSYKLVLIFSSITETLFLYIDCLSSALLSRTTELHRFPEILWQTNWFHSCFSQPLFSILIYVKSESGPLNPVGTQLIANKEHFGVCSLLIELKRILPLATIKPCVSLAQA